MQIQILLLVNANKQLIYFYIHLNWLIECDGKM